jgi:hypothetical protein
MLTCTVAAVEMMGLLLWYTGSVTHICRIPRWKMVETICIIIRETGFFSQWICKVNDNSARKVMFWQQCLWSHSTSIHEVFRTTAVAETWVLGILHHDGFCLYHLCETYDFVNGCNHGCKFCPTFSLWMRLNLPGMVLPTQGICKLMLRKIHTRQHSAICKRSFHLTCGVEYWVITWLDYTSRDV